MTTNKPEVKRYNITIDKYDYPVPYETEHGQWVKYSSYKDLQAECEKLRKAIRRLCNIYVVDDYYSGDLREELLDRAVERSIDKAMQEERNP